MYRLIVALFFSIAATSFAHAGELESQMAEFLGAPGFRHIDPMKLETSLNDMWLQTNRVSPSGDVGPLEKALLWANGAIPGTRTRTVVSYGELLVDDNGSVYPASFIEVRHFNLGPKIRDGLIAEIGAENVGSPDEFGTGDHRAWRFVFTPMMNNAAILLDASTMQITDQQAEGMDCLGSPCLNTGSALDGMADWQEVDDGIPDWPPLYPEQWQNITAPAHAVAELATLGYWADAGPDSYRWTGGEHPEGARGIAPFRFIGIERNLGQETGIDAIWHETTLNDDAILELYLRRAEVAGFTYLMRATIGR